MNRFLSLMVVGLLVSNAGWAAKFSSIKEMSGAYIEALAQEAEALQDNEVAFGDCSSVQRLSFERKAEEPNLNTVKQLNIQRGGLFHVNGETTGAIDSSISANEIVTHLLKNANGDEYEITVREGQQGLTKALAKAAKNPKRVELFEADHADEDGSWTILNVLDNKNDEVLLIKFGYCGT